MKIRWRTSKGDESPKPGPEAHLDPGVLMPIEYREKTRERALSHSRIWARAAGLWDMLVQSGSLPDWIPSPDMGWTRALFAAGAGKPYNGQNGEALALREALAEISPAMPTISIYKSEYDEMVGPFVAAACAAIRVALCGHLRHLHHLGVADARAKIRADMCGCLQAAGVKAKMVEGVLHSLEARRDFCIPKELFALLPFCRREGLRPFIAIKYACRPAAISRTAAKTNIQELLPLSRTTPA